MVSETPPFWWRKRGLWAAFLSPASFAYGRFAARRLARGRREAVDIPVLSVANLIVGGAGKTLTAMALARAAEAAGLRPGFACEGPPGAHAEPHLVDPQHDSMRHVGEQALELARMAPVAVSPDRASSARRLAAEGCSVVIVPDGFAGAALKLDYALIVVDAERGLGNGLVIPGGPLRAPLVDQLRHATGVLLLGKGSSAVEVVRRVSRAGRAVHMAEIVASDTARLDGREIMAFAGIAAPETFFELVRDAGGNTIRSRSFGAGHFYTEEDVESLTGMAREGRLTPVTTVRDAIRLANGDGHARSLLERSQVLSAEISFENADVPGRIIREAIEAWRRRR